MHRSNYRCYSITSARVGSEGGMVRPSAFGPNRFPDEDVLSLVGEQRPGTRSRRGRASEYVVNLCGHDEVVLVQSLDLLGLQRDRRIAPSEADIRMMAFGFREFTNLLNKGKRVAEIAKPEAPLDAVSFLRQLPVWGLCVKELSLLAREWRYPPVTGSAGFASEGFGHVACPSCQPSPA